jgi:hypothetical protein
MRQKRRSCLLKSKSYSSLNLNDHLIRRRRDEISQHPLESIDNKLEARRFGDAQQANRKMAHSKFELENTPMFPDAQSNAEEIDVFQKSGLSKFAAATVRLQQQKADQILLSGSSGVTK